MDHCLFQQPGYGFVKAFRVAFYYLVASMDSGLSTKISTPRQLSAELRPVKGIQQFLCTAYAEGRYNELSFLYLAGVMDMPNQRIV